MAHRRQAWLVPLLSFVLIAGCAAGGARSGGGGNPDVITREQIDEYNFSSALEVVQRIRPQWLRARNTPSFGGPVPIMIYMDNVQFGTINQLGSVSAQNVERLEWVDATTATQRWGTGNAAGAIVIVTRRGG